MSARVKDVKQMWSTDTSSQGVDSRGFSRGWTVSFYDFDEDNAQAAKLAEGIPRIKDPHPLDAGLFCTDVTSKTITPFLCQVMARYNVAGVGFGPYDTAMQKEWDVSWGFEMVQMQTDVDVNRKAIVNTNNEQFDPPVMMEVQMPVLTISRNEPEYDVWRATRYAGAVNEDYFYGAPPGVARMKPIQSVRKFDAGKNTPYYRVTYIIRFFYQKQWPTREAWWVHKMNVGYLEVVPNASGNKLRTVLDADGNPHIRPVPLQSSGQRVYSGGDIEVILAFQIYPELPFSEFELELD